MRSHAAAPPPLRRCRRWLLSSLLLLLLALAAPPCLALTQPDQLEALVAFRDSQLPKSPNWRFALASWHCPTPPANSDGAPCDPCGRKALGNWEHMYCRGRSRGWGESGDGHIDGLVTNVHITDVRLDGPFPRELCGLTHLRELDLDGGSLVGPVPHLLAECFPDLEELDLSYNRLTGTLPDYLASMRVLSEIKVEYNDLSGELPSVYGAMPRLRRLQVEGNRMGGRIPASYSNLTDTLTQLHLANNDFEGDLSALAGARPLIAKVHNNPRLCGMVPAGIRFAKAYNPAGTQLGQPCPQEAKGAAGVASASSVAAPPPAAQREAPKL